MRRLIWFLFGGHRLPDGPAARVCTPWTPWPCRHCRKGD